MSSGLFAALGILAALLALKIIIVIVILYNKSKNKDTHLEGEPQLHGIDMTQVPLPDHSQERTLAHGLDVCIAMDEIAPHRDRSPVMITIPDEALDKDRRGSRSSNRSREFAPAVPPRPSTETFAGVGSPVSTTFLQPNVNRNSLVPESLAMPTQSPKMSAFEPSPHPSPEPSRAPSPLGSVVNEPIDTDETESSMISTKLSAQDPAEAQPRRSATI